jgi:glycosyltransferase involved in cell wall biosynthesis
MYINIKMDIFVLTKDHDNYYQMIKIFNEHNLMLFDFANIKNMNYIKKIKLIIVYDYNDELLEMLSKNYCIIFTNLDKLYKYKYIYFENNELLYKYINAYFNNLEKTFTIIVPIHNSYEYLKKCVKSILSQNYQNYKIFLCDDYSEPEQIIQLEQYKKIHNITIYKNNKNMGKFATINSILNNIISDYFLIVDSDDTITPNRLVWDLIYFGLNKNAYAIISKYFRYDEYNKITDYNYGHNSISFKVDVIKKIGPYYPNRFGSDTEYIMRIKKYLGSKSIVKCDNITYISIYRKDNSNLSIIYDKNKRYKFMQLINKIHNNPKSLDYFINNKFDDLNKLVLNIEHDNKFNCDEYKKFYLDITNLDDEQLIEHWENIGNKEGRLANLSIFHSKFPNFDYVNYLKENKFEIKFNTKYQVYGWIYLKNKSNYFNWLKTNGYLNIINKNLIDFKECEYTNPVSLENYIKLNKIKYINVSKALSHFQERISKKFNLDIYNNVSDKFENTIFFGLYDKDDYLKLTGHLGKKYLMWGGTDSNINYKLRNKIVNRIKEYPNIIHLSISNQILKSLNSVGINSESIYLNMVDKNLFKPINNKNLGKKIFIYNGFKKGNEEIYGKSIYEKVIKQLPQYEFILSNQLNLPYEQMPQIYSQCFIGLRLTEHDGNANTVQEFNAMDIPIIFNGIGGIEWNTIDDIINTINLNMNKKIYSHDLISMDKDIDTSVIICNDSLNNYKIQEEINNQIIIKNNYKIIIHGNINLNYTDGCTNWLTNLINKYGIDGKKIIYLNMYDIKNDNFIRNIERKKLLKIKNFKNIDKIIYYIEKIKNSENIIIRSNLFLDKIDDKFKNLDKIIIYGLDVNLDNIKKLNNNFKEVWTQSEKLKELFVLNGILDEKIKIIPPTA